MKKRAQIVDLHITKSNFIEYYYSSGDIDESSDLRDDLAYSVINQLLEKGTATITIEDIFKQCNQDAVLYACTEQGYLSDDYTEIGDKYKGMYSLTLI